MGKDTIPFTFPNYDVMSNTDGLHRAFSSDITINRQWQV
uniref:Uncharacterized protein n=1 Tax=Lepeophtheirus salmonis TaxID=72036 RepID=A0A0K2TSB1_LEPSM